MSVRDNSLCLRCLSSWLLAWTAGRCPLRCDEWYLVTRSFSGRVSSRSISNSTALDSRYWRFIQGRSTWQSTSPRGFASIVHRVCHTWRCFRIRVSQRLSHLRTDGMDCQRSTAEFTARLFFCGILWFRRSLVGGLYPLFVDSTLFSLLLPV